MAMAEWILSFARDLPVFFMVFSPLIAIALLMWAPKQHGIDPDDDLRAAGLSEEEIDERYYNRK